MDKDKKLKQSKQIKEIQNLISEFVKEYQLNDFPASYFCMIIVPFLVEKEWIEEDVILMGHGPKKHLLETFKKRLEDIDDGTGDQPTTVKTQQGLFDSQKIKDGEK